MSPSGKETASLAQRFAADVARMRACLRSAERRAASDDELVRAWSAYSAGLCADWLGLPADDAELFRILDRYLPATWLSSSRPPMWRARLLDAGDGSGDCFLELPDALLDQLGWKVGDMLDLSVSDYGTLVLRLLE